MKLKTLLILILIYSWPYFIKCYAEIGGPLHDLEQSKLFENFGFSERITKVVKTARKTYLYRDKKNNLLEVVLNDDDSIRKQTLMTFTTAVRDSLRMVTPQLIFDFVSETSDRQIDRQSFSAMLGRGIRNGTEGGILAQYNIEIIHSELEDESGGMGLLTLTISKTCRSEFNLKEFVHPDLYVEGIIYDKINPVAIVNEQTVKIGDIIEGAQVSEITKDSVKFIYKGKVFTESLEGEPPTAIDKSRARKLLCNLEKGILGDLQVGDFAIRKDIIKIMGPPQEVDEEIFGNNYKYFNKGIIVLLSGTLKISNIYVYYSDLEEYDGYYTKFKGCFTFIAAYENIRTIKKKFGTPIDEFNDPIYSTPEIIYKKAYGKLHFCFGKNGNLNLVIMISD